MAIATETIALEKFDVAVGVPIDVAIPIFSEMEVYVTYGREALATVRNVDFTVTKLDANSFGTFTLTPLAPLLEKIAALIAADNTEINSIVVRRTLNYLSTATPANASYTQYLANEIDRSVARDQQLKEELGRTFKVEESYVGALPRFIPPFTDGSALVFEDNAIRSGPTADQIANANQDALDAEAARIQAEAAANSVLNLVPSIFVATKVALAALSTISYTHATLTADAAKGEFKRELTLAYSGAIANDPGQGVYVVSTDNPSYVWRRMGVKRLEFGWFDSVDNGTIDVCDPDQTPKYANKAALEAATIAGGTNVVMVGRTPFMRANDNHPHRQRNEIKGRVAEWADAASDWSITAGVATKVAGASGQLISLLNVFTPGKTYTIKLTCTRTTGYVYAATGGANTPLYTASGTYFAVVTATTSTLSIVGDPAFAGTVDLNTLEVREIQPDAIKSLNGIWFASFNQKYTPWGTGNTSGTDNLLSLQNANTYMAYAKMPLHVKPGSYRFQVPQVNNEVIVEYSNYWYVFSDGNARFIVDDDKTWLGVDGVGQTGNVFIGPPEYFDSEQHYGFDNHSVFVMVGITMQSTWWRDIENRQRLWGLATPIPGSPVAGDAAFPYRVHMLAFENTSFVHIDRCAFIDVIGFPNLGQTNGRSFFTRNFINRVCANGLRSVDGMTTMTDNYVLHCDDDSLTITDRDDKPNDYGPRPFGAVIERNFVEQAEGILALGPLDLRICSNTQFMGYGGGLSAYAISGNSGNFGEGGFADVIVGGNHVIDQMQASDRANPPDGAWDGITTSSMNIVGSVAAALSTATPVGEGTATPVAFHPTTGVDYPWGAQRLYDQAGTGGKPGQSSGARGRGLVVTPNNIRRTLPNADRYSDYGYGKRFTKWGFDNPAVADVNFAQNGLRLGGSFANATIHTGNIENFAQGHGVLLADANVDFRYSNVVIHVGTITDVRHGIGDTTSATFEQDIKIVGGVIDVDPYRRQPERTSANGWSDVSSAAPTGVSCTNLHGLTIQGVTFKNCANMWTLEGGAIENPVYNTIEGCIGHVGFGAAGTSTVHASNKGIGRIVPVSRSVTYKIFDYDTASGTFGDTKPGMRTQGAARPSSGSYVKGHQHVNYTSGGIDIRITTDGTGTAHVGGTDWVSNL